jgi:hypothetical protein
VHGANKPCSEKEGKGSVQIANHIGFEDFLRRSSVLNSPLLLSSTPWRLGPLPEWVGRMYAISRSAAGQRIILNIIRFYGMSFLDVLRSVPPFDLRIL